MASDINQKEREKKTKVNDMKNIVDKEHQRSYEIGYNDGINRAIKIVDNESMYYLQQEVIILKLQKELKK